MTAVDILAFGAHPDDAEIGAGGTLARAARTGARTAVITLTRGEMASRGTPAGRVAEFEQAASVLGLAHHEMLSMPDGGLASDEPSRLAVVREIREHRPRLVLVHYWEDRHPDHAAASRIVQEAAFLAGLSKLDTGQEPHRPAEVLYYMHTWEFEPSFVVDISDTLEAKQRALASYASQLHVPAALRAGAGLTAGPQTLVSSEQFWQLLAARAAHYGRRIGRAAGEPFRIRGLVEIRDLLEAFGDRRY